MTLHKAEIKDFNTMAERRHSSVGRESLGSFIESEEVMRRFIRPSASNHVATECCASRRRSACAIRRVRVGGVLGVYGGARSGPLPGSQSQVLSSEEEGASGRHAPLPAEQQREQTELATGLYGTRLRPGIRAGARVVHEVKVGGIALVALAVTLQVGC